LVFVVVQNMSFDLLVTSAHYNHTDANTWSDF